MKKIFPLAFVMVLFCGIAYAQEAEPVPGTAMEWGLEFERGCLRVGGWSASYTGDIKFVSEEDGLRIGEKLDLEDDLEVDNPTTLFQAELEIKATRRNRFRASYFMAEYTGDVDEVPGTDVLEFAGEVFKTDIETRATMNRLYLGYEFLPVVTPRGDLGIMLGVDYYGFGFGIESEFPDAKEDVHYILPIPVIGVEGRYTFGYGVGVYGMFRGIGFGYEDVEASYNEAEAGVTFKYKRLFASAGYRSINWYMEAGEDEDDEDYGEVSITHDGFLASVGVNF